MLRSSTRVRRFNDERAREPRDFGPAEPTASHADSSRHSAGCDHFHGPTETTPGNGDLGVIQIGRSDRLTESD